MKNIWKEMGKEEGDGRDRRVVYKKLDLLSKIKEKIHR